MQVSDRAEFVRVLNGLAAMKPGKPLTNEALDMWWASMQDWSIQDFKAAAVQLNKTVEFMPSSFHFEQLKRAGRMTKDQAWSIALGRCTQWREPMTRQPDLIDRVAQGCGGYRTIAMADTELALPHIERRFKESFVERQEVEETRAALPFVADAAKSAGALTQSEPAGQREYLARLDQLNQQAALRDLSDE